MKRFTHSGRTGRLVAGGLAGAAIALAVSAASSFADPLGTATGLPLPRFASLKTDRVNVREGPSKDHATKWVFQRAGLPVEITAEYEIWRKIGDLKAPKDGCFILAVRPTHSGSRTRKKRAIGRNIHSAERHRRCSCEIAIRCDRQCSQL